MALVADAPLLIASPEPHVSNKGAEYFFLKVKVAIGPDAAAVDTLLKAIETDVGSGVLAMPNGITTTEADLVKIFTERPQVLDIAHRIMVRGFVSLATI